MKNCHTGNNNQLHLLWLAIFGLAMGLMEAIIVVYLRQLYYPEGFQFPLHHIPGNLLVLESIRETCTMVMLVMIAWLSGKNCWQKLAWFIYTFAIWDISYYVGLKIFLNWPPSLFTWDVLFLIPLPWIAPVMAPIICALTMILMGVLIISLQNRGYHIHIHFGQWLSLLLGTMLILIAFMWDFIVIIINKRLMVKDFNMSSHSRFLQIITDYQPESFSWPMFIFGEILIMAVIAWTVIHIQTRTTPQKQT